MSQTAYLYRIASAEIETAKADNPNLKKLLSFAKDEIELQGSFVAIEYLLGKLSQNNTGIIHEIFYPSDTFGETLPGNEGDYERAFEMFESGIIIPYLPSEKTTKAYQMLYGITANDIGRIYDARELNQEGVYPCNWHDNEAEDMSFNKRHVQEDFEQLKSLFSLAQKDGDGIIVIVS